jgi:hypothetical protein
VPGYVTRRVANWNEVVQRIEIGPRVLPLCLDGTSATDRRISVYPQSSQVLSTLSRTSTGTPSKT